MTFKKSFAALVFALPLVLGLPNKRTTDSRCAFLEPIKKDLIENLFDGECGDTAHGALRLSFHDAIGISPTLGGGGADGSIIIFNSTELLDPGNLGIDDVLDEISPFFFKHADAITPGDFIQFAGALSLTLCPGAPRVKFFIGRADPLAPAPDNLVPQPQDSTDKIIERFAEVNFSPAEIVALLASHTVAGADDISPPLQGVPFDSTPAIFDTKIFIDVLLKGFLFPGTAGNVGELMTAINGTLRLNSDFELAHDPRTACVWQSFATDHDLMTSKFAAAFVKMGFLGQKPSSLIDCSDVIPVPATINDVPEFPPQQFLSDIQQSCAETPFPNLPTQPGPPLDVPEIPQADDDS